MKNPTKTTEDRYTGDTIMPFGQYKGKRLGSVPISYFNWCYKQRVSDTKLMIYIHRKIDKFEKYDTRIKWTKHQDLDKELVEDYKLPDAVIELFS